MLRLKGKTFDGKGGHWLRRYARKSGFGDRRIDLVKTSVAVGSFKRSELLLFSYLPLFFYVLYQADLTHQLTYGAGK